MEDESEAITPLRKKVEELNQQLNGTNRTLPQSLATIDTQVNLEAMLAKTGYPISDGVQDRPHHGRRGHRHGWPVSHSGGWRFRRHRTMITIGNTFRTGELGLAQIGRRGNFIKPYRRLPRISPAYRGLV